MALFYDLSKEERALLVKKIEEDILKGLQSKQPAQIITWFADEDTCKRKAAYLGTGRIYFSNRHLQPPVIQLLGNLLQHDDFKVRQSVINVAGEIGKKDFETVLHFFDTGLFDAHHAPRNAVIGSIKKMGEVNPLPVLQWAKKYLQHPDKEIRREICHGIELRGRKYPQDILPLLQELEHDKKARVKNTLIHVIGQVAYKKGCLPTVVAHLNKWENKQLVEKALEEIIDVHRCYADFSDLTEEEARAYIFKHYKPAR